MIFPNTTFSGQKAAICLRYIELYREEHNAHELGNAYKPLRAELDLLMPEAYHGHRIVWLAKKWQDVLDGQLNPDYPIGSEYLIDPIPEGDRELLTSKKDEAYQVYKAFAKWQREEHEATIDMLDYECSKALEECRQDDLESGGHIPTLSDFTLINGKRKLNVPSRKPDVANVNDATNLSFAMRVFEALPDMDNDHRGAVFEAISEATRSAHKSTFWDSRIDKELVRTSINMPEPPDPIEDFTTFTEKDLNSHIAVTASRATVTGLTRNENAYLYIDKGVDYFPYTRNYEHLISDYFTSGDNGGVCYPWSLQNTVKDIREIGEASEYAISFQMFTLTGPFTVNYRLYETNYGPINASSAISLSSAQYWHKIRYDKDVGTYGTQHLYVYSDVDRISLEGSVSLALSANVSARYLFTSTTYGDGLLLACTGFMENLDLQEAVLTSGPLINGGLINTGLTTGGLVN